MVPLNTTLPPSAIDLAFHATEVRHAVATAHTMSALRGASSIDLTYVSGIWLTLDIEYPGATLLNELLDGLPDDTTPMLAATPDDPYILTMTSGSTGDPKPIVLTQQTKINRASASIQLYGVTDADKTLAATPLYHSLAERLVLIPLLTGGTSILMSHFSPSEWIRTVSQQQVSFTISVSSQLNQIANLLDDAGSENTASLRSVVSSSALLDLKVKQKLVSKLDCDFHECYGASEIAIASSLNAEDAKHKLNSVGSAAVGVDIKILKDDETFAEEGMPGEFVCKTPMIFSGYFKRPDLTQAAMWGDYFRTGDIGKLDEDGFLYFLGRKKEIIITGGINVYPTDIETVIAEYGQTVESAAFSIADEKLGEIVAVALVPKLKETFNLRALRLFCADRLADYQQPRKFFIVEALPKNGMGKVMKHALQTEYGAG
jgi:long-chain acyl-CoA synthetase